MNAWFNYGATVKILVFSLLAGAALPGLFALGVRLQAVGSGSLSADGIAGKQRPLLTAAAWLIYAVVLVVVILGVLYIARDFIAHHTHYPFLGAKP
ncbi:MULTISPECIES: hypothetical protein [unclassified Mycobacterium]|uniref:hypothetical protein n=1 Tax=unclassified Mycobacterium TaxID=2642494 RepID=UPI000FAD2B2E|nr:MULTISPECIES: hypothetical protein [unclassified Mycobacterium]MDP7704022.1 hypothetical protein [Mycobacterium sp. TY815]MDP7722505.1 hypothetical protein [Mycobacterium sp. TY814]RUP02079.1 MAG: hypothetical protein EKK34_26435 [Mycobacterium sp.]